MFSGDPKAIGAVARNQHPHQQWQLMARSAQTDCPLQRFSPSQCSCHFGLAAHQQRRIIGFGLVECLIVMHLLGLMLALSWPSMQEMLARQQAQSYIRQFQQHLNFARIMAISSGKVVTFCPLSGDTCLNQWWQLPVQISQKQKNNMQKHLRILAQPAKSHWLYYNREQLQFRQDGSLQALQNGTFVYCVQQYLWHYRLTISQAGRSQSEFVAAPCPQS